MQLETWTLCTTVNRRVHSSTKQEAAKHGQDSKDDSISLCVNKNLCDFAHIGFRCERRQALVFKKSFQSLFKVFQCMVNISIRAQKVVSSIPRIAKQTDIIGLLSKTTDTNPEPWFPLWKLGTFPNVNMNFIFITEIWTTFLHFFFFTFNP